jgi:hypothetical protein
MLVRLSSLLLLASIAFAQSTTSSVNGTLVDPTGAAITAAACKLADQATGATLRAAGTGFHLSVRPASIYTLSITGPPALRFSR